MSLVNDLLIEVDRRRDETRRPGLHSLDGLKPRWTQRRNQTGLARFGIFAASAILFAGAAYLGFSNHALVARWSLSTNSKPEPFESIASVIPPAVSARPTIASSVLPGPIPGLLLPEIRTDQTFDRPIELRSISITNDTTTTRLRISADQSARYRIEASNGGRNLEITLESAGMETPITGLNLLGTPISSIQSHAQGPDYRLSLTLDAPVRVQSQWTEQAYGEVLVIDLQNSNSTSSVATGATLVARDPEYMRPMGETNYEDQFAEEPLHEYRDADRGITRSEQDQKRADQNARYAQAHRELEAARFARAEGNIAAATVSYETALETLPSYRDATLELATLLAETGHGSKATELIRSARRLAPRDTGLAMLHARLTAQDGNLTLAVEILDHSGFNLTQAPDIQALAAALLQQAGEHERAIERYETILRRFPRESRWWMGLGISLEARNRANEALDVYRIAIELGELPGQTRQWVSARVSALSEEG